MLASYAYGCVARLRPGVTIESARRELTQLLARVPNRFPEAKVGVSTVRAFEQTRLAPVIHTLRDDVADRRPRSRVLWLIAATVALLILVAFSNVSLLLLVRLEARQRELAVCSALGASRWYACNAIRTKR